MKKLLLFYFLSATLFSDSLENQDKPYIDTLSFKMGHSHAFTSRHDISGGVLDVIPLDESGAFLAIRVVFNEELIDNFQPYIEFSTMIYNDRELYIPSIGLRRAFESEDKSMETYISFGLGYAMMQRTSSPVEEVLKSL